MGLGTPPPRLLCNSRLVNVTERWSLLSLSTWESQQKRIAIDVKIQENTMQVRRKIVVRLQTKTITKTIKLSGKRKLSNGLL